MPGKIIDSIKSFLSERGGLYFKDHDLDNLQKGIGERMSELNIPSPAAYYSLLLSSEKREEELRELLNILTINHTYFFRNEPQFKALRKVVLPEIIAGKKGLCGKPLVRIWSAGCSTGEEPYSIAITAKELMDEIPGGFDIHILATDASEKALRAAGKGEFAWNPVKQIPAEYAGKHFDFKGREGSGGKYMIKPEIRSMVTFGYFNLIEDDFPKGFDIIFCRNVVIYFDHANTAKVMRNFHSSLNPDGRIFIGYSESLHYLRDEFEMVSWEDAIYYGKRSIPRSGSGKGFPVKPFEAIPFEPLPAPAYSGSVETAQEFIAKAVESAGLKKYADSIDFIDKAIKLDRKAHRAYVLKAEIYMNTSDHARARKELEKAGDINSMAPEVYYFLGCIDIEEKKAGSAKENLRKALYIDGKFVPARIMLANIHKGEGKTGEAIREYRNSLKYLLAVSPENILPYSGGFSVVSIIGVCRDNIERLKENL
ncbi:MAG: hypothetical protein HQL30_06115 [Candidatus Omnitrophica bacterium]|nr:hypothetical protein [Candidatus Omnitrophota bacterium]